MLSHLSPTTIIARHECKYRIRAEMLPRLMDTIAVYCDPDMHAVTDADGFYTVDSLYFDNDHYELYRLTEAGAPLRNKIRVRSYLSPIGRADAVKLEVKFRRNAMVTKTSASVPMRGWPQAVRYPASAPPLSDPQQQDAFNKFALEVMRYKAVPKTMVRYERAAFFGRLNDYVRITLDRRLQAQPVYDYGFAVDPERWQAIDDGAAHGGPSMIIMEVKFKRSPPPWIVQMIHTFGLKQQSFSKYGNAMRRYLREELPGQDLRMVRDSHRWIPVGPDAGQLTQPWLGGAP
jgi:VTC domain